jgi:hypothetical protein
MSRISRLLGELVLESPHREDMARYLTLWVQSQKGISLESVNKQNLFKPSGSRFITVFIRKIMMRKYAEPINNTVYNAVLKSSYWDDSEQFNLFIRDVLVCSIVAVQHLAGHEGIPKIVRGLDEDDSDVNKITHSKISLNDLYEIWHRKDIHE